MVRFIAGRIQVTSGCLHAACSRWPQIHATCHPVGKVDEPLHWLPNFSIQARPVVWHKTCTIKVVVSQRWGAQEASSYKGWLLRDSWRCRLAPIGHLSSEVDQPVNRRPIDWIHVVHPGHLWPIACIVHLIVVVRNETLQVGMVWVIPRLCCSLLHHSHLMRQRISWTSAGLMPALVRHWSPARIAACLWRCTRSTAPREGRRWPMEAAWRSASGTNWARLLEAIGIGWTMKVKPARIWLPLHLHGQHLRPIWCSRRRWWRGHRRRCSSPGNALRAAWVWQAQQGCIGSRRAVLASRVLSCYTANIFCHAGVQSVAMDVSSLDTTFFGLHCANIRPICRTCIGIGWSDHDPVRHYWHAPVIFRRLPLHRQHGASTNSQPRWPTNTWSCRTCGGINLCRFTCPCLVDGKDPKAVPCISTQTGCSSSQRPSHLNIGHKLPGSWKRGAALKRLSPM
mmetsp:Transcript_39160/g.92142  ORF Transcript_39160/g.92142 Transcript_39160/m.92142 type:complete len:453 (+) Transcript_39160:360-1718(+)